MSEFSLSFETGAEGLEGLGRTAGGPFLEFFGGIYDFGGGGTWGGGVPVVGGGGKSSDELLPAGFLTGRLDVWFWRSARRASKKKLWKNIK